MKADQYGMVDKKGNVVLEAKYDFIIGDSVEPNDIIVLGVIDSINKNIPYTTNAYVKCDFCASTVPTDEFWNVFTGDAERIFDIRKSEFKNEIHLTLDDGIRKNIERELGLRKTP